MSSRGAGAGLALIAAAFLAVSAATPVVLPGDLALFAGHPTVDGHTLRIKDVYVGLLEAQLCNTGGDGRCSSGVEQEKLGFRIAVYGELAATGLLVLAAIALAALTIKKSERRKTAAKVVQLASVLAIVGAGAMLLQGPFREATIPIGIGMPLYALGVLGALIASLVAVRPPPPLKLRVADRPSQTLPTRVPGRRQPAPQPAAEALDPHAMLADEQRPKQRRRDGKPKRDKDRKDAAATDAAAADAAKDRDAKARGAKESREATDREAKAAREAKATRDAKAKRDAKDARDPRDTREARARQAAAAADDPAYSSDPFAPPDAPADTDKPLSQHLRPLYDAAPQQGGTGGLLPIERPALPFGPPSRPSHVEPGIAPPPPLRGEERAAALRSEADKSTPPPPPPPRGKSSSNPPPFVPPGGASTTNPPFMPGGASQTSPPFMPGGASQTNPPFMPGGAPPYPPPHGASPSSPPFGPPGGAPPYPPFGAQGGPPPYPPFGAQGGAPP
ncbi:MAG TPA: hypothetical protein VLM79_31275, partial [Kofleriaceae bacterium]|nr:hypothetical protein [Kofleriaceae bacterium]